MEEFWALTTVPPWGFANTNDSHQQDTEVGCCRFLPRETSTGGPKISKDVHVVCMQLCRHEIAASL